MRILIITSLLILFSACAAQNVGSRKLVGSAPLKSSEAVGKQPILVELFTSEGCSSCPPAERILARLQSEQPFEKAEIITLALHVDYWDNLGWKDKFASSLYTQRQRIYDRKFQTGSIYTPQMIVDGRKEFIGSNYKKAEKAIRKAVGTQKAFVKLSFSDNTLKIAVSNIPDHEDSSVYIAITEDNLKSSIKRGENAGRDLKHISVVRSLKAIARIAGSDDSFETEAALQIQPDWKRENLKIVLFVQENESREIIGVARIVLN